MRRSMLKDPNKWKRGLYVQLGEHGLVPLADVARAVLTGPVGSRRVDVHMKGGGPPKVYRGRHAEYVKAQLVANGITEV